MGAWLFRFAQIRFRSRRTPDPLSFARADLAGALLCPLILGVTFALAFGVSALNIPIAFNFPVIISDFVVGTALGSLGSEWPLYITAITWLAVVRGKLPLRLMSFLECGRTCGVLRAIGQEYQIHDDGLLRYLLDPPQSVRPAPADNGHADSGAAVGEPLAVQAPPSAISTARDQAM